MVHVERANAEIFDRLEHIKHMLDTDVLDHRMQMFVHDTEEDHNSSVSIIYIYKLQKYILFDIEYIYIFVLKKIVSILIDGRHFGEGIYTVNK
jgi:hypothetical protein